MLYQLSYLAIPGVVAKLFTRDTAGQFSGLTRRQRRAEGAQITTA